MKIIRNKSTVPSKTKLKPKIKSKPITKKEKNKGYSKIATSFFKKLVKLIEKDFNKENIYYGENEYCFIIGEGKRKFIKPDFYIKDLKLVIEFYGDFWHHNPKAGYTDEISKLVNKKDYIREQILKNNFNCNVIIIWEKDVRSNEDKVMKELLKQIYILKS